MRVLLTEKWEYTELCYWDVEELPEGWDDWGMEEKHQWVTNNGEYSYYETDPNYMIEIEDVEVLP